CYRAKLLGSRLVASPTFGPKDAAGEAKTLSRAKRSPDLRNGATGQHFGNTVAGCAGGVGGQVLRRKKAVRHDFAVRPRWRGLSERTHHIQGNMVAPRHPLIK